MKKIIGLSGLSIICICLVVWFNQIDNVKSSFYKDRVAVIIDKSIEAVPYKGRILKYHYITYRWVEDKTIYSSKEYVNEYFYNNHNEGDVVNDRIEDKTKNMTIWFNILCVITLIGIIMLSSVM